MPCLARITSTCGRQQWLRRLGGIVGGKSASNIAKLTELFPKQLGQGQPRCTRCETRGCGVLGAAVVTGGSRSRFFNFQSSRKLPRIEDSARTINPTTHRLRTTVKSGNAILNHRLSTDQTSRTLYNFP